MLTWVGWIEEIRPVGAATSEEVVNRPVARSIAAGSGSGRCS